MPDIDSLRNCRVLLVEDETLVALLIEDMLEEIGCILAGFAASVRDGLHLASTIEIDVAVLDVNVRGTEVYPVAEQLASRNIPFVFSTGYGTSGLPEPWRRKPILAKPFLLSDLKSALRTALASRLQG